MSSVVRTIDFIIDQNERIGNTGAVYEIGTPAVKFVIDQLDDGTLRITASVFDNRNDGKTDTADIRGIFFHMAGIDDDATDDAWVQKLTVTGVGASATLINGVSLDGDDVAAVPEGSNNDNMNGRPLTPYDVGIGIGTSGMSNDDVKSVTFILDHATDNLTLEHLAQQGFGARLTSVGIQGGSRGDSLKLWGVAPNAPSILPPAPASLSDRVWEDTDGDGVQDTGETGLAGVTVSLLDASGATIATRVTDSNGLYSFTGLVPGQYSVAFAGPSGYALTGSDKGSDDAADSDADAATGRTGLYTLTAGMNEASVDAGFYKPAEIGDLVWEDTNKNGIQDTGEAGLGGVTVRLLSEGGTVVATTTTAANGAYGFSGVAPGKYVVEFVAPSGYVFTLVDQGSSDGADSDAGASGRTGSFTVASGTANLTLDAGVHKVEVTDPGTPNPPQPPVVGNDDLIEAGDDNDFIHGGSGNDEMQGEGGDDTIYGGTDRGELAWAPGNGKLNKVLIGDNLYGNDGRDTYRYAKGDGVDMIWDYRPGDDVIELSGYSLSDIRATWVGKVANWIGTPKHNKLALVFSDGGGIVFNDYSGLDTSTAAALRLGDGTVVSFAQLIAMAGPKPASEQSNDDRDVAARSYAWRDLGKGLSLYGGNEKDKLIGATNDDNLYGNEGVNGLNGKDGNDQLYGGNTRDAMLGGTGDDIGYGNGGDDLIVGGAGSDRLYGTGGVDYIFGDEMPEGITLPSTFAADLQWLQDEQTVVTSGTTTLSDDATNVAATGNAPISLTGNGRDNVMSGNSAKNTIKAGMGNDRVSGGYGNDLLYGESGRDAFVFDTALGSSTTDRQVNFDKIADFDLRNDRIYLDNAVFKKLGSGGSMDKPLQLKSGFFTVGAQAKDKNDYIVYNKKTGVLSYDADGSGSKYKLVEFAQVKAGLDLKYTHFFVI